MKINHCVVVIKQTALSRGGRAADFAKQRDPTAHRLIAAHDEHHRTIKTILKTLARKKISTTECTLSNLNQSLKRKLGAADFVISIGGDGTTLGASHYIRHGVLLGVNSAPGDSIGHFCPVNRRTFPAAFEELINDRWRPLKLARLEIELDGAVLSELALNDVLITHRCPAATTRYLIEVGERREEQRSSGIWISTAAGSTAGIHSAGGRVMPLRSRRIQFLVRELYREPRRNYELTHGMIEEKEEIIIASKMPDAELYIDGVRTTYHFPFGMRARIKIADSRLKIFLNN